MALHLPSLIALTLAFEILKFAVYVWLYVMTIIGIDYYAFYALHLDGY